MTVGSPYASFDCLVALEAGGAHARLREPQLHLLAYLAMLAAVYDGSSDDQWGYTFCATVTGTPYSKTLADALRDLCDAGYLAADPTGMTVVPRGGDLVRRLSALQANQWRRRYMMAACDAAVLIPEGSLRWGLLNEPALRNARAAVSSGIVLDGHLAARALLVEQFSAVRQVLHQASSDLVVALSVWLRYLNETAETAV